MKSKKKEKKPYSSKELDIKPKDCKCDKCNCVGNYCDCEPDGVPVPTPEPTSTPERRMYNRRAIQADIDKVKKVKQMLASGHYNLNQIAGGLMIPLERVKQIQQDVKTNT